MPVDLTIPEITVLLFGSLLGTLLTAVALRRAGPVSLTTPADDRTCFVFCDTELVDATGPASVLAQQAGSDAGDHWQDLRAVFRARFGDLPDRPGDVFAAMAERRRTYAALAQGDGGRLVFSRVGDRGHVSLLDNAPEEFDRQISFDRANELRFLRNAVAEAPTPMRKTTASPTQSRWSTAKPRLSTVPAVKRRRPRSPSLRPCAALPSSRDAAVVVAWPPEVLARPLPPSRNQHRRPVLGRQLAVHLLRQLQPVPAHSRRREETLFIARPSLAEAAASTRPPRGKAGAA